MIAQKQISLAAWIGLGLLALIWGGSFMANAVMLKEMSVYWIVASRVSLGALVLWIYVIARGYRLPRGARIWADLLIMGLFNNVVPFILIAWGQQHIASGLASILNAATAFFAIIIAAIVFSDERLTARKIAGVSLGFGGVVLVIGLSALKGFSLASIGQLAVLGAAVSYGLSATFARARLSGIRPEIAATGMLTCSSLVMIPLAYAISGAPNLALTSQTLMATLYLAILSTGIAYLLYYRILAAAGTGNTALVTLLVTPVAVALGALLLRESLAPQAYGGFALIALGMLVIDGRLLRIFAREDRA
ncbi:MAG: DMT family transporter [Paracoccaceae bacterium]